MQGMMGILCLAGAGANFSTSSPRGSFIWAGTTRAVTYDGFCTGHSRCVVAGSFIVAPLGAKGRKTLVGLQQNRATPLGKGTGSRTPLNAKKNQICRSIFHTGSRPWEEYVP